jgi:hypothetical protein
MYAYELEVDEIKSDLNIIDNIIVLNKGNKKDNPAGFLIEDNVSSNTSLYHGLIHDHSKRRFIAVNDLPSQDVEAFHFVNNKYDMEMKNLFCDYVNSGNKTQAIKVEDNIKFQESKGVLLGNNMFVSSYDSVGNIVLPKNGKMSVSISNGQLSETGNNVINSNRIFEVNNDGVFAERSLYVDGSIHSRQDISIIEDDRMKPVSEDVKEYDNIWNIISGLNVHKHQDKETNSDMYSLSGQEVVQSYPAGARKITSFIPDVYEEGSLTHLKGTSYIIQMGNKSNLKADQEIKIISSTKNIFCKVLNVEENLIKVDIPLPIVEDSQVIVYGSKKKDICCIYKDRIVPLLLGCIKDLNERVKALENRD